MRNKFPWNMLLGLDPNLVGSPFRNKQKSAELEMFLQQHQKRQVPTSAKLRYLARFFFKWFFWWVVLRPSAHGSIHPPAALDGENRSPSSKGYALGLSETRGMAWLKSPLKKKNDIDRSWDSNRYPGPSTRLMKKLQFVTKQGFHLRNVWTNFILKQIKTLMLRMKRNFGIPRITSY